MPNVRTALYGIAALSGSVLLGVSAWAAPIGPRLEITSHVIPAAMCGRSCNSGGQYFPGPPEVCSENGLNYCGPSGVGPHPEWA